MQRSRAGKTLSCAECRRLKIKCDLQFPCKHCSKRGLEKICPSGELSDGIRGQRVLAGTEELHRRIADLEYALTQATAGVHSLLAPRSLVEPHRTPDATAASLPNDASRLDSTRAYRGSEPDLYTPAAHVATDKLSAYSHLVVDDETGRSRYYGAASSVYLAKRSNMNPQTAPHTSEAPPPLFDLPIPNGRAITSPIIPMSVSDILVRYLPNEDYAREMSDLYYKSFGWFTNIVPLATFDVKYFDPIYHTSAILQPQNVTLLFLILALGVVMDTSRPNTSDQAVRSFITAARQSLALDMSHSVTMVQICYLYVTFIMNGRKDTSGGEVGWPYLRAGMAIAEAIGLHRDPGQWGLPEDDATERRIVFWEIHGYDVLQSIALGRGQCIADLSIDCGLPEDGDETLFHRMAYKLTRIWSSVNERQIRISPSPYSDVIDIDEALNEYERSLPHHLSPGIAPSLLDLTDPARKRLAFRRNMLLMYLTEARMAVHRGWYVRTLREYPNDPLSSPQSRSFINCLEACRALVALVRNMLALHDQQINKRWHFFFHLFSACACLAACAIRAPTSTLAPVVMGELDSGISLFKMAGRDETIQLERLAELGREAIRVGSRRMDDNSEDLDLLSARQTLHRSHSAGNDANRSPSHGSGRPNDTRNTNPASVSRSLGCSQLTPTGSKTNAQDHGWQPPAVSRDGLDLGQRVNASGPEQANLPSYRHTSSNSIGGQANATSSAPPLAEEAFGVDIDWGGMGDFDMNAFLEEMGLLN